jgi:hypothetical protein
MLDASLATFFTARQMMGLEISSMACSCCS